MAEQSQTKQVRVVLWCMPRTVSTAMVRAMHNRSSSVSTLEPYARSYYLGEERASKRFDALIPPIPGMKYADIKSEFYEAPYPDKSVVFMKDMALYMMQAVYRGTHTIPDVLPKNYVHTFLIRKPEKAIKSMYNMYACKKVEGWDYWSATEAGFKEVYDLYTYVKENVDPNPLVIDADDLIAQPEKVLRCYCARIGVEFEQSMLEWNPNDGLAEKLEGAGPWAPFWNSVVQVNTFVTNTPAAARDAPTEIPPEVYECIKECQEWYDKMLAVATRF